MEKIKLNIQRFAVTKTTTFEEPALTNAMITGNYSTLKITIYFSANNNSTWFSSETLSCTCNGVTQTAKVAHPLNGSTTKTFTFTNIAHNSDGNKTVSWSWSCATGTNVLGTVSASGTKKLQTIPRASTPSFNPNPVELGQAVTISLDKKISGATETLTFSVNGATGTIGTTTEDSYIWTPSLDLADYITTSETATCVVTCTTSKNGSTIGSKSANLTLQVPSSIHPTISIGTITEANAEMAALSWNVFIKDKSQLHIPLTFTPSQYGETISSATVSFTEISDVYQCVLEFNPDPQIIIVTSTVDTNIIPVSGTLNGLVNLTDSRGRLTTQSFTVSLSEYNSPVISVASAKRVDANNVEDDGGIYLNYDFSGSVTNVGGNVAATTYKVRYKLKSASSYTDISSATFTNVASITKSNQKITSPTFPSENTYDILFEITDAFNVVSVYAELDSEGDLMNFNDNGTAMAIGKVSEAGANDKLLEVNLPTVFYEDVEVDGDITIIGDTTITGDTTATGDTTITGDITATNVNGTNGTFDTITLNSNDLEDTLYYKPNDVVELGDAASGTLYFYVMSGYVSSSTKNVMITVHLPKKLNKITTITVNKFTVEARGISGYLNSTAGYIEYVGKSGYTVSAIKVTGHDNAITIVVAKSSAWTNTTNNTLIEMNGYFKLTLT